jgi:hypothetical protein
MITAIKVRERPIILHPHELRAALGGRLSLIVRPVIPTQSAPKIPPLMMEPWMIAGEQQEDDDGLPCWSGMHPDYPTGEKWFSCPWGRAGELLWVREAWAVDAPLDQVRREYEDVLLGIGHGPYFRADPAHENAGLTWRSPSTMPRWASRTVLKITSVGVRRVESITPGEAWAAGSERQPCARCDETGESEGGPCEDCDGEGRHSEVAVFMRHWNAHYSKRAGLSWADNPFCWFVLVKQAPL